MSNIKRPARLDIVDMPRDTTRALGGLRQAICASFNYCRRYPAKMAVLKSVVKYTYNRIVQWEKEQAVSEEKSTKIKLEEAGRKVGIELDARQTVENMRSTLEDWIEEKASKQASAALQAKAEQLSKELAKTAGTGKNQSETPLIPSKLQGTDK
tara:strand:- start:2253 stop:2714 length:462 start_codon:yes stop_codon:yes gene_type:complete